MCTYNKILIVGPAWIGDMVMAQSLFKLLRQRYPNVIIHVLAPKWTCPLLEKMPEVSNILISPFEHKKLNLYKRYLFGKELRREKYDQAIILPNSFKSALIPFWAKIPKRTGWRGEMRFKLLNDMRKLNKSKFPTMIQRFVALGLTKNELLPKKLPWPSLRTNNKKNNSTLPILALCPGAEYGLAKRWPIEYFADVALEKINENWEVWLFGGNKDQPITKKIQKLTNDKCTNLAGKTSLSEAIDLLSCATVVVSNDTGLMHIAAALNKPLIVVYGSSSPIFTPPLVKDAKILSLNLNCSPCFKRECPDGHFKCLRDLKPHMVKKALNSLKKLI